MTIRADILAARGAYEDHVARHHCSMLTHCEQRRHFWNAWMDTARQWGQDSDDDDRQREHYQRNVDHRGT